VARYTLIITSNTLIITQEQNLSTNCGTKRAVQRQLQQPVPNPSGALQLHRFLSSICLSSHQLLETTAKHCASSRLQPTEARKGGRRAWGRESSSLDEGGCRGGGVCPVGDDALAAAGEEEGVAHLAEGLPVEKERAGGVCPVGDDALAAAGEEEGVAHLAEGLPVEKERAGDAHEKLHEPHRQLAALAEDGRVVEPIEREPVHLPPGDPAQFLPPEPGGNLPA
jgi:hypothetical protein